MDYWKVFFPLIKRRANKYEEYVKWESSALLALNKLLSARKNMTGFIQFIRIEREFEELYENKKEELNKKFGPKTYYHQIWIPGFFIEPVLLILIGLFGSVLLRKIRGWREDRIKRRKAGIILSLTGVGVLAAFLPLSISARDETGITILSIAGVTLILVGIGMVIFSFFPEEKNPKK
jgi:hypothetical protein